MIDAWEEYKGKHYQRVTNAQAIYYRFTSRVENANIYYCKEDHGLYYMTAGKLEPIWNAYKITEAL